MRGKTEKLSGGPITGVRQSHVVSIQDTPSVCSIFNSISNTPWDIRTRLVVFASECKGFLKSKGLSTEPESCEIRVRASGFDHPSIEWYCAQIINLNWSIFHFAEVGDVWNAVDLTASLAMYSEQMRLLGYEKLITRGQAVTAGGEKGAESRHGSRAERDARVASIQAAFAEHLLRIGPRGREKAKAATGKQFGLTARQVHTIVKKLS